MDQRQENYDPSKQNKGVVFTKKILDQTIHNLSQKGGHFYKKILDQTTRNLFPNLTKKIVKYYFVAFRVTR